MDKKHNASVEGSIFDNTEIVNAVENNSTVINHAVAESTAGEQPVFAVTKGNIGTALPYSAQQIQHELNAPRLRSIIEEVRAEHDEEKQKKLKSERKYDIIGICPHYYAYQGNHRTADTALAECCTYKTCVDIDNRQYGQQAIDGALRLNEQPGMWHGKLLYIENSLRGGGKVHIWLTMPVGMTVAETQQQFCKTLGIPCDESVQQKQAFILMTGDAIYRSPAFLQPLTQQEIEARQTAFQLRGLGIDGWPVNDSHAAKPVHEQLSAEPTETPDVIEPTPRTDYIFESFWCETGLEPSCIRTDGKCHNSVKSLLSTGIVDLLTQAEMLGQLRKRTPDYWNHPDCRRLVRDFYQKYNDGSKALSKFQRKVLSDSEQKTIANIVNKAAEQKGQPPCDELTLDEIYASQQPPRMNRKRLPRLVKTIISSTPELSKETVAQACFPSLEAHPVGLSFKYIDQRPRELRSCCLVVAETGSGKSCVDQPIDHIMADIKAADAPNRKKEYEYNEKYNTRNSNQEKPQRPKLSIRALMPDVTKAALVRRTDDADGAPLYVKMNEVEQFDKIEQATGKTNQFTNMKINDDEGNDFGQERAGTQSVNAATTLFLNWNASTTPSKAIRYFRYVMVDGPISRLCLATHPDPGIGAPMPVFGEYGEKYDAALKPFIDNLNMATGYINCLQARQMINRLKKECDEFGIASQDKTWNDLTHRALVHAFRKACTIYAANGMKWENTIETFCRWSLHYDLWLKMHFFGELIKKANEDVPVSKHGPRNMLELLPDEFTFTDVSNLRYTQGKDREGTSNQIYQWVHRGFILHLTDDRYKKTPKQ